jgi:putative phosphoesterase
LPSVFSIGVISDTHGLLRPEAVQALQGVDHIVHAGDIGTPDILVALAEIASVTAVRGNHDKWAAELSDTEMLQLADIWIYVLHDIKELDLAPTAAGINVVVSGHTHEPSIGTMDGVLYVNPGSAGPERAGCPVALARLYVEGSQVRAEIVPLAPL